MNNDDTGTNNKPVINHSDQNKNIVSKRAEPTRRKKVIFIGVSVLAVILLLFAILYLRDSDWTLRDQSNSLATEDDGQNSFTGLIIPEDVSRTVLFMEFVGTKQDDQIVGSSRQWDIRRIVDGGEPESLAQIESRKLRWGPSDFELSPDNSRLLINLEGKLQLLDIDEKRVRDIFMPNIEVSSISYSPDGSKVFIVDSESSTTGESNDYYFHILDLESGEVSTVQEDETDGYLRSLVWRDDDYIILNKTTSSGSITEHLYYFNTSSSSLAPVSHWRNSLTLLGERHKMVTVSKSGYVAAYASSFYSTACGDDLESGGFVFVEPVSGSEIFKIGDQDAHDSGPDSTRPSNKVFEVVAYSPDEKEVMYTSTESQNKSCEIDQAEYYKAQFSFPRLTTEVSDIASELKSWNIASLSSISLEQESVYKNTFAAKIGESYTNYTILINDEPVIASENDLAIIGQFYQ